MPWDTEAYDTYTVIPDSLGFAGIYRLIGINSTVLESRLMADPEQALREFLLFAARKIAEEGR
jgi:hypothetical protein